MKFWLRRFFIYWLMGGLLSSAYASEVREEIETRVRVRGHPKTGRPYVSIVSSNPATPRDPFAGERKRFSRPDYRLLNPKIKSGEIPYDGPWSDSRKVYALAAVLASLGMAGGALGILAAPAATGAASSGGAGAYFAGASGVVTGVSTAVALKTHPDPEKESSTQRSESRLLKFKSQGRETPSEEERDDASI